jgi:hypothetical protein
MGPDGVEHLLDTDGLDLLGPRRPLNEHLLVKIVVVLLHEGLSLSQEHHDVDTLL